MENLDKALEDLENKYGTVDDTLNKDETSYLGRGCPDFYGGGSSEFCKGAMAMIDS